MSNARIEASRRNGAKSRGPRTAEGKARSAPNALKHGLRAQKYVVLPDEDAAEFHGLEAALLAELAPVGALQTVLARRMAVAAWRLARADRMEAEVFAERGYGDAGPGLALIRDGNGTRSIDTLLRYRGAAMAEFMRALRTLKALQAEQAANAREGAGSRAAARVSRRPEPNEPTMGAAVRLHDVVPDPRVPIRTLHEPAAPWMPNQHETGPRRADDIGARLPNEPEGARERNDMKPWASACQASAPPPVAPAR